MSNNSFSFPHFKMPTPSTKGVPWNQYVVPAVATYLSLCWLLRYRRRDAMAKKFNYPDKASLSRMTNVDAQAIMQYVAELEFPKLYEMSVQFALFKTYGIPTISGLLCATKEFSTPETANKRYADTGVLIQEFSSHNPTDERVLKAIARMNYLHSRYQKAGKISNEDLLYTLSVFITEPVDWIKKYEWRALTDMEKCAIGTFWKSIGDAMGIPYQEILGRSQWADGLEFAQDISTWAQSYESSHMVPAATNRKTADELLPLLLFYVPKSFRPTAINFVGVLMPDILRKAMLFSAPPRRYFHIVSTLFFLRRTITRHILLPRPASWNVRQIDDNPDPITGRLYMRGYLVTPYYNKPGFLNRWGPEAWLVWAAGGKVPGQEGQKYLPKGYRFEEVGPKSASGKGVVEMAAIEKRLSLERPVGCPFAR